MPPANIALRLSSRWCAVMVAATLAGAADTYSTASRVVTCSSTKRKPAKRRVICGSTVSMNTASRSNTSTSGSVTSPCTSSGRPRCFHRLERREAALERGHAGVGIGGGAGRVILHRVHHAARLRQRDFRRRGVVGEIQRHQRFEARTGGQRREYALAVGQRQLHGGHRRTQIGHDDGAARTGARCAAAPRRARHRRANAGASRRGG